MRSVCATTVAVGKAMSITQSVSVFVALGIQYATRMSHIIMWPTPL